MLLGVLILDLFIGFNPFPTWKENLKKTFPYLVLIFWLAVGSKLNSDYSDKYINVTFKLSVSLANRFSEELLFAPSKSTPYS